MAAPLWLLPSPPPLQSSPFLSTNSSSSPSPHPHPLLCKKKQAPTRSKLLCSSSSSPSVVTKKQGEAGGGEQPVAAVLSYKDDPSFRGCKACGKEEMERGCNGEGRIQGGIATVPGFGWWPIKAYRPCPGFVASGGRYRRQGQSMDEVASGRAKNALSDRKKSGKKSGPAK